MIHTQVDVHASGGREQRSLHSEWPPCLLPPKKKVKHNSAAFPALHPRRPGPPRGRLYIHGPHLSRCSKSTTPMAATGQWIRHLRNARYRALYVLRRKCETCQLEREQCLDAHRAAVPVHYSTDVTAPGRRQHAWYARIARPDKCRTVPFTNLLNPPENDLESVH